MQTAKLFDKSNCKMKAGLVSMEKIHKIISLLILLTAFTGFRYSYAEDNIITVNVNEEAGRVNKLIFGNNFIAYAPFNREQYVQKNDQYADFGAGIWNPRRNEPVNEVIELAKNAGLSIIRFPGGTNYRNYNWKEAINKNRKYYSYGIDEFMRTVEEIGSEALITISYFTGDERDAADLVEYLNSPNNGKNLWALERDKNGSALPYNVKYFEIGNEVYAGNGRDIKRVLPEEYANKYLKYYDAMKKVDPTIKIGVILNNSRWNRRVLEIIKNKVDFGTRHIYPTPFQEMQSKHVKQMKPSELFRLTLAIPLIKNEVEIRQAVKLLKEKAGTDIPVAITEYNIGFPQHKPISFRHSLGGALINAELINIFMRPENRILMANYWQFSNSYWGMIKSADNFMQHDYRQPIRYVKRPNYFVYELYNQHFGEILLRTDVKSKSYDINGKDDYVQKLIANMKKGSVVGENVLNDKWEIRNLGGVNAEEKKSILYVDFVNPSKFNYYHAMKRAKIKPDTYYRVSGYIKSEGLIDKEGVSLLIKDVRRWSKRHFIQTEKIFGTNDWQYIDVIYRSLPDAESCAVVVRRIGEYGPLKGKIVVKGVKVEEFIPETNIPYLSVNASKSEDEGEIYLMVVNKNMDSKLTSTIKLKNFRASHASVRVLKGDTVNDTNENYYDNVKLVQEQFQVNQDSFEFTFEPASLTAIEIKGEIIEHVKIREH